MLAIESNQTEAAKASINEFNADLRITANDTDGNIAITQATRLAGKDIVEAILKKDGKYVNRTDKNIQKEIKSCSYTCRSKNNLSGYIFTFGD